MVDIAGCFGYNVLVCHMLELVTAFELEVSVHLTALSSTACLSFVILRVDGYNICVKHSGQRQSLPQTLFHLHQLTHRELTPSPSPIEHY